MSVKRPGIYIYVGDILSNQNLARCTMEEKGAWLYIMFYMHDSDYEYGILRWTLKEIAQVIGCKVKVLRSLIEKGILKGSDEKGKLINFDDFFAKKHGKKVKISLIKDTPGPLWFSSRMVRDEYLRKIRGNGGFKSLYHPNVPKKMTNKDTGKDILSQASEGILSDESKDILNSPPGPASISISLKSITTNNKIMENAQILNSYKDVLISEQQYPISILHDFKVIAMMHEWEKAGITVDELRQGIAYANSAHGKKPDRCVYYLKPVLQVRSQLEKISTNAEEAKNAKPRSTTAHRQKDSSMARYKRAMAESKAKREAEEKT